MLRNCATDCMLWTYRIWHGWPMAAMPDREQGGSMTGATRIAISHPSVGSGGNQKGYLPFVVEASAGSADISLNELLDWLSGNRIWREDELHRAGALLFR